MSFDMDAPDRNLESEARTSLEAQIELAPEQFEAAKRFRPKFAQLQRDIIEEQLLGTDEQPGLLETFREDVQPQVDESLAESTQRQREADVESVEELGPRATRAFEEADPLKAQLLDTLTTQAQDELESGGLSDFEERELQQQVRGSQAARGFGFGPTDAADEVLRMMLETEDRRRRNQRFAQGVVGLRDATTADPFQAILGRPARGPSAANQRFGQAAGVVGSAGGQDFDPFRNPLANEVASFNANKRFAEEAQKVNTSAALTGAGISALGRIGSAAMMPTP